MHCIIPGEPIAKARARFSSKSNRFFTPPKTARWEKDAAVIFFRAIGDDERRTWPGACLRISIEAIFKRPMRLKKMQTQRLPKTTKPDLDNVVKAIQDALVKGASGLMDDQQIVEIMARKWYAAIDESPHIAVTIDVIS